MRVTPASASSACSRASWRCITVARSADASVAIKTASGASCFVEVEYDSGASTATGLADKKADSKGVVMWNWTVGRNTKKGPVPVKITCTLGNKTGSADTTLTVK